ncbi:GTPase LSG1-2-like isoform X1 [Camellia sinensis]|uniref:GTPase LSG1-2-like isoform X1 n=1 Tax=Camellia sinensis TaxID=4442 RepID=UPI001036243C|nr:GTPase LSG1-2-like isoform X1 [Camellia sinensis]
MISRDLIKSIDGKLPHFEMPPGMSNNEVGLEVADAPISSEMHESDSSCTENPPSSKDEESTPNLEHVLNYLNSFDMANGLRSGKVPAKKKRENVSHKQHKKPQRKKYRSWRVGGEVADGIPVVRVFQKPANTGPLKVG